ncbi:hypothetical protein AVEN_31190-1 [Araneus ventricosus]|uniref:Cystatin domain-containing protein n=1 Tax=Araneus ventricosus TaxID=182803 RepID=A0A4Y2KKT9_ARAVE|nr:hypothetical protein AVEN_31190-1 [Araneus ventricosus]
MPRAPFRQTTMMTGVKKSYNNSTKSRYATGHPSPLRVAATDVNMNHWAFLVTLTSRFEATLGLFWIGSHQSEPLSDEEDDTGAGTPSPNFHTNTPRPPLWTLIPMALSCALLLGRATVDPNDEEVVKTANEAAKVLSKQFTGKYHHKLARVLKASKQDLLGGTYFQMDIVVGQTLCRKDEYEFENTVGCDFHTGQSTFKKCIVTVFRGADGKHKVVVRGCILATGKEIEGI